MVVTDDDDGERGGPMMMTVYKGDRGEGGSQVPLKRVTSFMNGPEHVFQKAR